MRAYGNLALFLTVALGSVTQPQVSHAFYRRCYEPTKPSCIGMLGISRDEFSFDMCRGDMDSFRRETEEYMRCLDKQKDDAVEEYNKTIKEFNCYAQGNTIC